MKFGYWHNSGSRWIGPGGVTITGPNFTRPSLLRRIRVAVAAWLEPEYPTQLQCAICDAKQAWRISNNFQLAGGSQVEQLERLWAAAHDHLPTELREAWKLTLGLPQGPVMPEPASYAEDED